MNEFNRICFCFVERSLLHNARTNRCHCRTESRAHDGCHQVSAECRTGHLHIGIYIEELAFELGVLHVQRRTGLQEVDVSAQIYIQVGAVCAQTGMKSCGTSRRQVSSDVGSAEQHDFRLVFFYHVTDDFGVSICGVILQKRAVAYDDLIGTVTAQFLCNSFYVFSQEDTAQVYSQFVCQLPAFGNQLKSCRHHYALTLLTENPYILESSNICTIVSHKYFSFLR